MCIHRRDVGADLVSARGCALVGPLGRRHSSFLGWRPSLHEGKQAPPVLVALLLVCSGVLAAEPAARTDSRGAQGKTLVSAPRPKAPDRTPKRGVARVVQRNAAAISDLRLLGNIKVLEVKDGEALLRVDGVNQTIRPGMLLKTDMVQAITPKRMVLVRGEGTDDRKGETLIVVEFGGAGQSRVWMYATRDWTARPPRPVE
jgi:hypothetical protein